MVSEGTSNPGQLITNIVTIGKGNGWNIINYQWRFLREISLEGYDLGSNMVGRQTLQLENFNLTLPNAL